MAVRRGKPEPILDDVLLCLQTGWTWQQLQEQPNRFVEKMRIYLNAENRRRLREAERLREELQGGLRRI